MLTAALLVTVIGADIGEVDVTVANDPATVMGELDNIAFGVKEEQGLCRADRKAGVGALAAAGNFGTDLVFKDL